MLLVSYCGQSMSVVRHASSVVRRAASTIVLKAYSSYAPGPIDSKLGRKYWDDFVVCLSVCHFVLVFFSPFSIAITSLGEERANLSAFRRICSVACLDLLVSSSSWGLGRAAVCDCGTPWTFLLPFL